jgi:hypothetical protein
MPRAGSHAVLLWLVGPEIVMGTLDSAPLTRNSAGYRIVTGRRASFGSIVAATVRSCNQLAATPLA